MQNEMREINDFQKRKYQEGDRSSGKNRLKIYEPQLDKYFSECGETPIVCIDIGGGQGIFHRPCATDISNAVQICK